MNAGRLSKKAVIQNVGSTTNEFGEVVEGDFVKFKDVWCSIIPVSGKESFLSNADFAKTTHKIKIRYIDGVNASQRLLWNTKGKDRIFDFIGVVNIAERDEEIEIKAEEVING